MVISDEIQKKYGFLLQPIKDLTRNWDVDVAHILEDYLEELEKMTFSFDNGNTVLNFAEASLLIQGTACVWSKKVEYLYTLVKQTLDMITSKKEATEQNSANATSNQSNVNFDDEDEKLLILDDITITSERLQTTSYDPIGSIPIVPIAMLENDADNRGRVIINLNKNDTISHTNDFWEACFVPLERKMSVLDRDSNGVLDKILVPSLADMENAPTTSFPESIMNSEDPEPPDPTMDDIVDDAGDCGELNDMETSVNPELHAIEIENEPVQRMQLRGQRNVEKLSNFQVDEELPTSTDPHTHCTDQMWVGKQYQKLKSFRIPESLLKNTRKRKLHGPSPKTVPTISQFMSHKGLGKNKMKVENCSFSVFSEMERKARNLLWKNIKKETSASKEDRIQVEGLPGNDIGNDSVFDEENFGDGGDEFLEHSDHVSPDLDDLIGDVAGAQGGQKRNNELEGTSGSPTSYEDLVRHHVEMFYQAARRHKEETALAQRVKLWDEAITPRLAEQDLRPEFDIHKYGDIMLGKFENPKETKKFEDIANCADSWYICRLFAATLQLVNDNNFLVTRDKDFSKSVNTMELTLLSHHKLRERLDEYNSQM